MLPKLIGVFRLTRDPELSYTPNQTPVCEMGLAASEKYGEKEQVCFVTAVAFGKKAEVLNKHFQKGKEILIAGKENTDRWQNKEGKNRSKQKIVIDDFGFVGSKGSEEGSAENSVDVGNTGKPEPPEDDNPIPF